MPRQQIYQNKRKTQLEKQPKILYKNAETGHNQKPKTEHEAEKAELENLKEKMKIKGYRSQGK